MTDLKEELQTAYEESQVTTEEARAATEEVDREPKRLPKVSGYSSTSPPRDERLLVTGRK
jgi:hypothetical protein